MKQIRLFSLSVFLIFLLTACGGAATATSAVTQAPAPTETPAGSISLPPTPTVVSLLTPTSQAALSLADQMAQIDVVLKQTLDASIAYNTPSSMTLDQTVIIELLLNPSLPPQDLSTQVSEPGQVTSTSIQITPRMKAVLLSLAPDTFIIKEMHDSAEQVISPVDTTAWRWSVTAKKGGAQTLELIMYQLVKYDGKEYWREIETYKANIVVNVTVSSWIKSLDWKWIASAILIPLAAAAWGWWRNKKKNEKEKSVQTPKKQV